LRQGLPLNDPVPVNAVVKKDSSAPVARASVGFEVMQKFESIKEGVYVALDVVDGTVKTAAGATNAVITTAKKVQQLPQDLASAQKTTAETIQSIEESIEDAKDSLTRTGKNIVSFGEYIYRVVTLVEAKKAYANAKKRYEATAKWIKDLRDPPPPPLLHPKQQKHLLRGKPTRSLSSPPFLPCPPLTKKAAARPRQNYQQQHHHHHVLLLLLQKSRARSN